MMMMGHQRTEIEVRARQGRIPTKSVQTRIMTWYGDVLVVSLCLPMTAPDRKWSRLSKAVDGCREREGPYRNRQEPLALSFVVA